MIIGQDTLSDLRIKFDFTTMSMEWNGTFFPEKDGNANGEENFSIPDPVPVGDSAEGLKKILDATCEQADLRQMCQSQNQLNKEEQEPPHAFSTKCSDPVNGALEELQTDAYEVELRPDAKSYYTRAHPTPRIHTNALETEVERLCKAGVLKGINCSEWTAPTVIIPKKDGSTRFISDFRELNKGIKLQPYPIPRIQDTLLNPDRFRRYEYQRVPMGLCNSPDIFQRKMGTLMQDLENVCAYIDDQLLLTNGDLVDHVD